jgi:SAM-dependent methyltransferase
MMDRLTSEQHFHDQQARQRAAQRVGQPDSLQFDDECYLNHESWIRPALTQLGDIRDRPVLDFGCGHGMAAVVLARRGARVTAFDLSRSYLEEASARAAANGVHVHFVQADGERLPFADSAFAAVWGNAVLHHLDMARAGAEIRRVLRPGGVAVFCEPWGGNPLLNWARRRLPYPGKQRTRDEMPLRQRDFDVLKLIFPAVEVRGFQLASMLRRAVRWQALTRALQCCDQVLLSACPGLQHFCRYVVVTLRR